jgi:serine/threonine protein kinase
VCSEFEANVRRLLKKLLTKDPGQRITLDNVKKHPAFLLPEYNNLQSLLGLGPKPKGKNGSPHAARSTNPPEFYDQCERNAAAAYRLLGAVKATKELKDAVKQARPSGAASAPMLRPESDSEEEKAKPPVDVDMVLRVLRA